LSGGLVQGLVDLEKFLGSVIKGFKLGPNRKPSITNKDNGGLCASYGDWDRILLFRKFGTDLVRPRERLSGNWGNGRTLNAERE
jgi:hypothetical protein